MAGAQMMLKALDAFVAFKFWYEKQMTKNYEAILEPDEKSARPNSTVDDSALNTQKLAQVKADLFAEIEAAVAEYELDPVGQTEEEELEHKPVPSVQAEAMSNTGSRDEVRIKVEPDPQHQVRIAAESESHDELKITIEPEPVEEEALRTEEDAEQVAEMPKPVVPRSPASKSSRKLRTNPNKRTVKQPAGVPRKSANNIFALSGLILVGIVFVGIIFAMDDGKMGIRPPEYKGTPPPPRPLAKQRARKSYKRKGPKLETGAHNAEAMEELEGLTMGEYMRKHNLDKNQYLLLRQKAIKDYWEMRKKEKREAKDSE